MLTHDEKLLSSMLDELGGITDEPGRLTRTFLSSGMERAVKLVGSWLQDAGLDVKVDPVGNLIGLRKSSNPKAKTLIPRFASRHRARCGTFRRAAWRATAGGHAP